MKKREIRAVYDEETITVYQAFNSEIAKHAIEKQKFVSPFKFDRMTWIKPSFLWMMYRSGWGTKEGQNVVLAIKIKRFGFEWALENSCLSTYNKHVYETTEIWKQRLQSMPVRIQWDPEKSLSLNDLNYKSIQIGMKGRVVEKYVHEWIVEIKDITEMCHYVHSMYKNNNLTKAKELIPLEDVYPIPTHIATVINAGD